MSMHKKPLTEIELSGMEEFKFPIGSPSQLSDAFRIGVYWYEKKMLEIIETIKLLDNPDDFDMLIKLMK